MLAGSSRRTCHSRLALHLTNAGSIRQPVPLQICGDAVSATGPHSCVAQTAPWQLTGSACSAVCPLSVFSTSQACSVSPAASSSWLASRQHNTDTGAVTSLASVQRQCLSLAVNVVRRLEQSPAAATQMSIIWRPLSHAVQSLTCIDSRRPYTNGRPPRRDDQSQRGPDRPGPLPRHRSASSGIGQARDDLALRQPIRQIDEDFEWDLKPDPGVATPSKQRPQLAQRSQQQRPRSQQLQQQFVQGRLGHSAFITHEHSPVRCEVQ